MLRTLKVWQAAVLVGVLVGVASGTYGVFSLVSGSGSTPVGENQQLIPVQYGNLVNQVSTNGSLVFPSRVTLTFGTQGTVGELAAVEGQQVKKDQVLARLDAASMASLERTVAQARVNLRNAEDALAKAKSLQTSVDLAQAEARVADARLALKRAEEALDTVKSGPTADDLAKAQAQVDSARTSLANAEGDLKLTQKDWDSKVKNAQEALGSALDGYRNVFDRWLGIKVSGQEQGLAPDALLASWGVDLASLFDPSLKFQDIDKGWLEGGPPPDNPSTPWSESNVYFWLNMFPGSVAPSCEDGMVPNQGFCVKKEMDDAWDAYQKAQDGLSAAQIQASKGVAGAESALERAKESLATVEEALADLKAGPDPLEVDAKAKQLVVAQANLAAAEADLSSLKASAPLNLALKQAEVTSAKVALDTAILRLDSATLKAPMAGIVSLVSVEAGQMVGATASAIELVDPATIELDGVVDQVDVLFVRQGARADVTLDALPGQVLQGTVSSIAAAARSQQGVVSYPISISVQVPQGVDLREGLSATASIVIRQENNVILLPLQALYGTFDQPVVKVMNNGRVEERPVVLGNSDDYWVAVRQGLAQGEQVVMQAQAASTGQFSLGSAMRQFQGQGGFTGPITIPGAGGGQQRGGSGQAQAQSTPRANR